MLTALRASFVFLSILVPGKIFSNSCIKRSTFFYPVVGIVLGIITSYACLLILKLSNAPSLASVLYLILFFFLTRGLHHDGLADTADAWGSCARGSKFRIILKDSRIGSFGTIVLILYFLLSYTALTNIFSSILIEDLIQSPIQNILPKPLLTSTNMFYLLLLAPIWGRIGLLAQPAFDMPYIPTLHANPHQTSNSNTQKNHEIHLNPCKNISKRLTHLSFTPEKIQKLTQLQNLKNKHKHRLNNESKTVVPIPLSANMIHPFQKARFFVWFFAFILGFLLFMPISHLLFILGFSFFIFVGFYALSKREKGYNGDFLGAQCLCFETIVFLSSYI